MIFVESDNFEYLIWENFFTCMSSPSCASENFRRGRTLFGFLAEVITGRKGFLYYKLKKTYLSTGL